MPFEYICKQCSTQFIRHCRPNSRSTFSFCSRDCKALWQQQPQPKRQRIPQDRELLIRLYWGERLSTTQIANRFEVGFAAVSSLFRKLGIPLRTASERAQYAMSRRSPEDRKRNIANAQASLRGVPKSAAFLHRHALGVQQKGKLSEHEGQVLSLLREAGYSPVPLLAITKYNIDIAFPDLMTGFEITSGGWHRSPSKRLADDTKAKTLRDLGWTIHNLNHQRTPPDKAVQQIIAILGGA